MGAGEGKLIQGDEGKTWSSEILWFLKNRLVRGSSNKKTDEESPRIKGHALRRSCSHAIQRRCIAAPRGAANRVCHAEWRAKPAHKARARAILMDLLSLMGLIGE